MACEHDDWRLEAVLAQDPHRFVAVDVGQADIHDHQIDLSRLAWKFLAHLHEIGRQRADTWLASNFDRIGVEFERRSNCQILLMRP